MGSQKDTSVTSNFSSVASQYKDIQKQAWASQDVKATQVDALKSTIGTYIDSYIQTHASDSSDLKDLQEKIDTALDSMSEAADLKEKSGQLSNASWDSNRVAMEALLAELAPEGADEIYSPVATQSAQTDEVDDADEEDSTSSDETTPTETKSPTKSTGGTTSASGAANNASGTGWNGDILVPATSAEWKGLSLDQMLAKPDSMVAKEIGNQPDVIDAIRKVSGETGVPTGLIAAMIIQESNGNRNDTSGWNDGYANLGVPKDQQVDSGLIQAPLWQFSGNSTADKKASAADPYTNLSNFANWAKDIYAEHKSWGQVANMWYTGDAASYLDGKAAGGSSEEHYVQNVLGNLALGGSSYGS